jgi:hypothetical protein
MVRPRSSRNARRRSGASARTAPTAILEASHDDGGVALERRSAVLSGFVQLWLSAANEPFGGAR